MGSASCGAVGQPGVIENVPVTEVWTRLKADPKAVLIDVRTRAEWAYVGVPDLSSLGRSAKLVEWQTFPEGRIDPAFVDKTKAVLAEAGAGPMTELFFICRSGGRSHSAALAMSAAGFAYCRNVAEGFEGPLDAHSHRGKTTGWKAAGLPWIQG